MNFVVALKIIVALALALATATATATEDPSQQENAMDGAEDFVFDKIVASNPELSKQEERAAGRKLMGCPEDLTPVPKEKKFQKLVRNCVVDGDCPYGKIECWDTSRVTNMARAFYELEEFNMVDWNAALCLLLILYLLDLLSIALDELGII